VAVAILDVHDQLAGRNLKDFDFAVFAGSAAARGQELSVGGAAQRHKAVHKAGDLFSENSCVGIPETDFLKAAAGQVAAVRTIGQSVNQRQVRGMGRLLVRGHEARIDQGSAKSSTAGIKNVNLIATSGCDGGLIGTD